MRRLHEACRADGVLGHHIRHGLLDLEAIHAWPGLGIAWRGNSQKAVLKGPILDLKAIGSSKRVLVVAVRKAFRSLVALAFVWNLDSFGTVLF